MPTNLNSLLIAWALTLMALIGGALWVELSAENPAPGPETVAADASSPATEDPGPQETAASGAYPENTPDPAITEVTVLPRPEAPDRDDAATDYGSSRLAPGEVKPASESAANEATPAPAPRPTTLIAEPNSNLLIDTRNGPLPRISANGVRPAEYYAAPKVPESDRPRVAVLVTDMGAVSRRTERALQGLPDGVGIGFSPYSADLTRWTAAARTRGYEYYLMLPMEPVNAAQNDPGPLGLLTRYTDQQNVSLLQATLGQTTGYVGVVTHMGSRFSADSESLRAVMLEIQQRGLIFIDSRATPYTRAGTMAQTLGIPVLQNDRFVDNDLVEAEILRQLTEIENKAKTLGGALALARPYPVTIRAISSWAEGLESRGFDLVPVSSMVGYQSIR